MLRQSIRAEVENGTRAGPFSIWVILSILKNFVVVGLKFGRAWNLISLPIEQEVSSQYSPFSQAIPGHLEKGWKNFRLGKQVLLLDVTGEIPMADRVIPFRAYQL